MPLSDHRAQSASKRSCAPDSGLKGADAKRIAICVLVMGQIQSIMVEIKYVNEHVMVQIHVLI